LGVTALEDKLVQRATTEVLNAIYETDFLGFSYGFRPGRSQHNALDALYAGLLTRKVNWVFDADIRGFFDAINREWLMKFVEHRVADRRVGRLIRKWLGAGVLEDGVRTHSETGTVQGGSISPLLANVYLHYAFDLWVQQWRKTQATGDVIVVRYADDFIVGFQQRAEAEKFLTALRQRFAKFGLELHPDKTRLIEFGPWAAHDRRKREQGKPETFNFLGFTHICAKKRDRKNFTVLRQTMRKRLQAKLAEVKAELRRRMHDPVPEVGKWLRSVVEGHFRYYGGPKTPRRCRCSVTESSGSGTGLCVAEASVTLSRGTVPRGWLLAICLSSAPIIPTLCGGSALLPETRAGCGNPARPDPWRGCPDKGHPYSD
jgi:group II intron reverse transcriptase/maturase